MSEIRRILVVELLGGIGDVLIALPAIQALARSHPSAHLTVLTFPPGGELLYHHPLIHQVVFASPGNARSALETLLAQSTFDLIVSDTNYDGIAEVIKTSSATRVVTNLWRSPPDNQRVGDRFLSLLLADDVIAADTASQTPPFIHLTASEGFSARQFLGATYRPLVVLYPDAGMAIKRWSCENFIQLGQALQQRYGVSILVPVGSDPVQAESIVQGIQQANRAVSSGTVHLLPKSSLRSLAATIAQADLMIVADTGPARIAAALGVPTITLFGPSWQGRYGQPTPHVNLQGYPHCPERQIQNFTEQSCWYSGRCPFDRWNTCLEDITPATVLAAAANLLPSLPETPSPLSPSPSPPLLSPPNNILILRLDNIGDVIMTAPTLKTLRETLPDATLTLMTSPAGALAAPLLPWIDDVLPWRTLWQDLGRLDFNPEREWELVDTLKARQFDAAIILTSFSQSPHPAALLCALAGIPVRIGESKETDFGTLTHAVPPALDEIHQVDRNLRLVEFLGFHVRDRRLRLSIPTAAEASAYEKLDQKGLFRLRTTATSLPSYLLLNPWTTCQSRNYDTTRFAQAARKLSDLTGWPVVITGVEKDRDRAQPLVEVLGDRAIDLIGETSLVELVALIAGAKLVLTNNTSTMHIADATQTPNVILFSGTEYECQWRPRYSPSRLLRRPTVCSPCYAFTCSYNLQCLDLSSETVVAAALELLNLQADVPNASQLSGGVA